ncbi:MAG: SCP2 sterol-binding domain-containing protein [Aquihabitans sp.]
MLAFLSPDWLAALDEAAQADPRLAEGTASLSLVVEQRILKVPGADSSTTDLSYHVSIDHGQVSVVPGPAPAPTVRFSQDLATARAIAQGSESAQRAFMTGRIQVGGDLRALVEHQEILGDLADVFASVRARTDFT